MDCRVFLFFVYFDKTFCGGLKPSGFGFNSIPACLVLRREYHYINLPKSWMEAQRYCREHYTDLATFDCAGDLGKLNRPNLNNTYVWIGLHDDPKSWKEEMSQERNSWRWSMTGKPSTTGYQKWQDSEPNNIRAEQLCGIMMNDGFWVARPCHFPRGFICYDAANPPDQSRYILNKTKVTWKQAQEYCRKHHTDLVKIENDQEQNMVFSAKAEAGAAQWTGLYRVPWAWSNRGSSDFTNFKSFQPDNDNNNQYCVAEQPNHQWIDENCDSQFPFLCHEDIGPKSTMVRMKMKSDANLSELAINTQLVHQLSELLRTHDNFLCGLKWKIPPRKDGEDGNSP